MAKNSPQRRNAIYEKAKQDRPAIVSPMSLEMWWRVKQKVLRKSWLVWKCEFIQGGLLTGQPDGVTSWWEQTAGSQIWGSATQRLLFQWAHISIFTRPSTSRLLTRAFWGDVFSTLLCVQPWWANNECVWTSVSSHIYCTRVNQRSNDNLLSHNPWSYPNPEAEWSPPEGRVSHWLIESQPHAHARLWIGSRCCKMCRFSDWEKIPILPVAVCNHDCAFCNNRTICCWLQQRGVLQM